MLLPGGIRGQWGIGDVGYVEGVGRIDGIAGI